MSEGLWTLVVIGLIIFGVTKCQDTDAYRKSQAEASAHEKFMATPHAVSTKDGCTVYEFVRESNPHYFTRCGTTTTTERNYTESCGKNCVKHKTEEITTENTQ